MTFDPTKRLTVEGALNHKFVARFRQLDTELVFSQPVQLPIDDNKRLSIKQYQSLLFDEPDVPVLRTKSKPMIAVADIDTPPQTEVVPAPRAPSSQAHLGLSAAKSSPSETASELSSLTSVDEHEPPSNHDVSFAATNIAPTNVVNKNNNNNNSSNTKAGEGKERTSSTTKVHYVSKTVSNAAVPPRTHHPQKSLPAPATKASDVAPVSNIGKAEGKGKEVERDGGNHSKAKGIAGMAMFGVSPGTKKHEAPAKKENLGWFQRAKPKK